MRGLILRARHADDYTFPAIIIMGQWQQNNEASADASHRADSGVLMTIGDVGFEWR